MMRPSLRAKVLCVGLASAPVTAVPASAQSSDEANSSKATSIVLGAIEAAQEAQGMPGFKQMSFLHDYNTSVVAGTPHPILCRMFLAGFEQRALHMNGLSDIVLEIKAGAFLKRNPDVAGALAKNCAASASSGPGFK